MNKENVITKALFNLSDNDLIQLALDFDNVFIPLDSILRKVTSEIYDIEVGNVSVMQMQLVLTVAAMVLAQRFKDFKDKSIDLFDKVASGKN